MTGSHNDPRASDDDLDPTGVRALLANLPDPGPMPDDLMARITQSLELEQERRATAGTPTSLVGSDDAATASELSSGTDATSSGGTVVSLTAERERRRPGRTLLWLGGAAAVAMVATVSVNQLLGTDGSGDSGVAANVPVTTDSADSGAEAGAADGAGDDASNQDGDGSAAAEEDAGAAPQAEAPPAPSASDETGAGGGEVLTSTRISTMPGTVELSTPDWADEVSAWLVSDLARGESDWGATQASTCVEDSALDTRQANSVLLSQALWEDEPATLVVAEESAGSTAWVLSPDCQEILSGPALLD